MATAARGCLLVAEKARRCVRTVIFMVAMLASLLVSCLPVLVAIGDVVVPLVLVSNFTCLRCYGFKQHFHRYAFKSSLTDIPLVSVVRSFIVICAYTMCSTPALSHGPYLGTVTLCSFTSILLLSVKACLFSVHSQMEAEASLSLTKKRLHLKKSWGMPVLFLSSAVFALGHTVVAYRTSCRARRKLLFHRVDPEAVLSCKNVFSGFQKVPRSPTPTAGRTPRSDNEMRQKPFGMSLDEGELPIRSLADINSLFITCQGITVHYKICFPNSPPCSLSSTTFLEPNPTLNSSHSALARIKLERQPSGEVTKGQYHLPRSYSNHFQGSSLYAPLLDGSPTSAIFSEEIPVLNLDDVEKEEVNVFSPGTQEREENGKTGIILVHGFGGGVFSWRHVMGTLARQVGCAVVAFDRPGWGLSSRPRRKDWEDKELPNPYKLESQVDLLLSFCHELGFSSVVFVGHDDGGLLALMAAQRVKESMNSYNVTVNGVVLLNVSLSREVVPGFAKILLRTSLGKKHLVRPLLRTEIMQVVNRRAWYDATKLTTEVLNLYKAPLYVEGWDEALHEMGKLGCETVLSPQTATTLLKAVEDISVLVIAGAEDVLVPVTSSQTMALQLVNSRLVAISGCGHLPHEECSSALLAAMAPFISRICKTTSTPEV